jgi:hypothetical protein
MRRKRFLKYLRIPPLLSKDPETRYPLVTKNIGTPGKKVKK